MLLKIKYKMSFSPKRQIVQLGKKTMKAYPVGKTANIPKITVKLTTSIALRNKLHLRARDKLHSFTARPDKEI